MKKQILWVLLLCASVVITSCQKEYSFEAGSDPSSGSLQEDISGECLPKTVFGIYEVGTALVANDNYIEIQVDVTEPGSYSITTNQVNGIRFSANGFFNDPGLITVKLRGNGTPVADGIHNFTVSYDGTDCVIPVTILPEGGGDPAVFTLNANAGTCVHNLSGEYAVGVPLGITNKVTLNVSVTTPGTYNITTTTVDGITFSGTGVLTTAGVGTIELTATGTPGSAGIKNIGVTAGSSTCSFDVTVAAAAEFTVDCNSAIVNGAYTENQALAASNTIEVDVNVTTAGVVVLNGTVNGMTFFGTATLAAGSHTITLTGTGTPAADGDFDLPLTGSTGACNVEITVDPGTAAGDAKWKFNVGATLYEGTLSGALIMPVPPNETLTLIGSATSTNHSFTMTLSRNGSIATGSYLSSALPPASTVNFTLLNNSTGMPAFSAFTGTGSLTVVVETYDVTNKVVSGKFSGTAKDASNNNVTITNGEFKDYLP